MTALLHKLCLDTFQHAATGNCLEASVHQVFFSIQSADLKDSPPAKAVAERHETWKADLPKDEAQLWDWLAVLDDTSRAALLAHCVSFGVNALYEKGDRYGGPGVSVHGVQRRLVQADRLARAVGLDMVEAGWRPTVDNYLGRVTKPRILEAVREAKGEQSAQLIDHLKKAEMAKEAERLLDGTGWLPEPLRIAGERTRRRQRTATPLRRPRRCPPSSPTTRKAPATKNPTNRPRSPRSDDPKRGGKSRPAHLSIHPQHARPLRRALSFQETIMIDTFDTATSTGMASDWDAKRAAQDRLNAEPPTPESGRIVRRARGRRRHARRRHLRRLWRLGQIENIEAKAGDAVVAIPAGEIEIAEAIWASQSPAALRVSIVDAIERLAYDLLERTHCGWENNDGADGDFTFDVAERTITLDYNERYTASEYSQHVF